MYLGSDAIALAPFTDTISYLEDGDWAVLQPQGRAGARRGRKEGQARGAEVERLGVPGRQGQPPPFHGEGNPRAARSRRPYAGALSRHGGRARAHAGAAVRFRQHRPHFDFRLRHGLLCRHDRQILVRAFRAAAGRDRCRVGIPLPRGAVLAGRSGDLRLAVGRDRRHARDAALRQGAEAAHPLGGERADLDHRARKRRGDADAGRPRDRRRLDQGLHLPACRARLSGDRGRQGARHPVRGRRAQAGARADRGAAPDDGGARRSSRRSSSSARDLAQKPRRALSRPRHVLSDRARRRAEAEGNLLHPRRGLCGGRAQARPDRADRRDHAGDRDRAL